MFLPVSSYGVLNLDLRHLHSSRMTGICSLCSAGNWTQGFRHARQEPCPLHHFPSASSLPPCWNDSSMMALLSFVLFLAAPDTGRKLDTVAVPCICVQLVGDSTPAARQAFPVSLSSYSAHTGQPRDGFGARGTGWSLYKIHFLMVALQPRACPTMKPTTGMGHTEPLTLAQAV